MLVKLTNRPNMTQLDPLISSNIAYELDCLYWLLIVSVLVIMNLLSRFIGYGNLFCSIKFKGNKITRKAIENNNYNTTTNTNEESVSLRNMGKYPMHRTQ